MESYALYLEAEWLYECNSINLDVIGRYASGRDDRTGAGSSRPPPWSSYSCPGFEPVSCKAERTGGSTGKESGMSETGSLSVWISRKHALMWRCVRAAIALTVRYDESGLPA